MTARIWAAAILVLAIAGTPAIAGGHKPFSGIASYYDKDYAGGTASGARYDPDKLTAAHRTLPFGTRLRITDTKTRRSVVVTVNDRGPFTKGRALDLSYAAAEALHMHDSGLLSVMAEFEAPAPK